MTVITAPLAFSEGAYHEAIELLHETRDRLLASQAADDDQPADRLRINAEYSRVASRLAHVVAWLVAQKAVQAGEVPWEDALDGQPVLASVANCTDVDTAAEAELPDELRDLLARSRALYTRVARLDHHARTVSA